MSAINENAFNYLTQENHSRDELSSFSLKREKESSRTKIANVFRGTDTRCKELLEQCEVIVKERDLTDDQKTHLKNNARELKGALVSSKDREIAKWASKTFQEIQGQLNAPSKPKSRESSDSSPARSRDSGERSSPDVSFREGRESPRQTNQEILESIGKKYGKNNVLWFSYLVSPDYDPAGPYAADRDLDHNSPKTVQSMFSSSERGKAVTFDSKVRSKEVALPADSLKRIDTQFENMKIIREIREETRLGYSGLRKYPGSAGRIQEDREKEKKLLWGCFCKDRMNISEDDFFQQIAAGEFVLPADAPAKCKEYQEKHPSRF